ncbi:thiamine-phosphate kinase [Bacillus weihaiensis]|uniref:Thiamine-monophosphate kinase n=1 Tax=Bacillus weihaiensis TaxID=1547283 RepID=A0A1L3MW55_9BACI|nr:thiamine-phosphate kinase [Bacillus weihaiensis]APH06558.1 thiamine-phosphate kinase [Bacillus weihaiensis]
MDEFDFISKVKPNKTFQHNIVTGIGDDAAIYKATKNYNQVVCVDTMVEGIHFLKELSSPTDIGYKALAVNVSDIAAMGAIPRYYLVSIAIPPYWKEEDLLSIYNGMEELAKKYEMDLIGGDTVSIADKLVITVTVIGEVEEHVQALRSCAKPGDIVFVTGPLGDSAAGLDILLGKCDVICDPLHKEYLISRHKRPTPRVEVGRFISLLDRVALNDISDGLASELNELAESSHVGIVIQERLLPVSPALKSVEGQYDLSKWILFGGEDFELVGATSEEEWEKVKKLCHESDLFIEQIGTVTDEFQEVRLKRTTNEILKLKKSGFNHFRK